MHLANDLLRIAAIISSLFRRGSIHNKQLQYDVGVVLLCHKMNYTREKQVKLI